MIHCVFCKPIWSLRVTYRGEPLRVVGVEWEDSGIEYRKDGKGKDNVGCVHSLLKKINNKMQAQVSANSLSGPPQFFLHDLTQRYYYPHVHSKSHRSQIRKPRSCLYSVLEEKYKPRSVQLQNQGSLWFNHSAVPTQASAQGCCKTKMRCCLYRATRVRAIGSLQ